MDEGGRALAKIGVCKLVAGRFDAVVVGSDLGSMVAATCLAAFGRRRVVVLEREHVLGGSHRTAIRPGGYAFDANFEYASGWGAGSPLWPWIRALTGDALRLSPVAAPLLQSHDSGSCRTHSGSTATNLEAWAERYPRERAALKRYRRDLARARRWMWIRGIRSASPSWAGAAMRPVEAWYGRTARSSLSDYLARTFQDPELRDEIAAGVGTFDVEPTALGFGAHAWCADMDERGCVYPRGRATSVVDALLSTFVAAGGRTMKGLRVESILTEGGRVQGVRAVDDSGQQMRFEVPHVVCGVRLPSIAKLLGVSTREPAAEPSVLRVHYGLKVDPQTLGMSGHFHRIDAESRTSSLRCLLANPGRTDPASGGHAVSARVRWPGHDGPPRAWLDAASEAIEAEFPGFGEAVAFRELVELSSPWDSATSAGPRGGATSARSVELPRGLEPCGRDQFVPGSSGAVLAGIAAAGRCVGGLGSLAWWTRVSR